MCSSTRVHSTGSIVDTGQDTGAQNSLHRADNYLHVCPLLELVPQQQAAGHVVSQVMRPAIEETACTMQR